MDTISLGVTLAFVAEAVERGWLDKQEIGVPFGWGDLARMLRLVEMTRAARASARGSPTAPGGSRPSVHPEGTKLVYAVKASSCPRTSARALKGLSSVTRPRPAAASHHDTRPTPQYAQGFDRRGTADKPAFRGAQPALHPGRGLARHLPLHVRAWLRPLRRRAVRHDGPRGHRLRT